MQLANEMARYYADPLGFVLAAYPWGQKGTPLENEDGPDADQRQFLSDLGKGVRARAFCGGDPVMPILMTATSGHGTGKSVLGAWIGNWILSTRPDSIGTVTAGTWRQQLENRTWAALVYWTSMCVTGHWFNIQARGIYHKQRPKTWKIVAQTCKENTAQAFAGQHASTSTSWYMFDEASLIPDKVWTVAMGGLSDGEPMWFAWGQPERNSGRFYEINFGKSEHRWNHRRFDSRTSRFPNKELMAQLLTDYGEDSDVWRVRVLGLPPMADELQFIDRALISGARRGQVVTLDDDPLIAGFDASGGGSAWNVVRFRRGFDARSIPPLRVPGEHSRDRSALTARAGRDHAGTGGRGTGFLGACCGLRLRSPIRGTAARPWLHQRGRGQLRGGLARAATRPICEHICGISPKNGCTRRHPRRRRETGVGSRGPGASIRKKQDGSYWRARPTCRLAGRLSPTTETLWRSPSPTRWGQ